MLLLPVEVKGLVSLLHKLLLKLEHKLHIVLISSLAGKQGVKDFSVYAASKAAVISLAKSFAAELISKKIRVNTISPGIVKTAILQSANLSEEMLKTWVQAIPMHRFAIPTEIAQAALFLASDYASYITAEDIAVDGGSSGISFL